MGQLTIRFRADKRSLSLDAKGAAVTILLVVLLVVVTFLLTVRMWPGA